MEEGSQGKEMRYKIYNETRYFSQGKVYFFVELRFEINAGFYIRNEAHRKRPHISIAYEVIIKLHDIQLKEGYMS